jgi:hypothetical protein
VAVPAEAAPPAPVVLEATEPAAPPVAEALADDLWALPGLPLEAPAVDGPLTATAELATQPAGSSTDLGGGLGAVACFFTGLALLTICVTLWWHGRRFARAV